MKITELRPWGDGEDYPDEFSHKKSNLINLFRAGNAEGVRNYLSANRHWLGYYFCGESLLHFAAKRDFPDVLAVLVDLGLDVNTPEEKYPWGALMRAVDRGALDNAKWLLEHGAHTTYQHRGMVFSCGLLSSVAEGQFEMVKALVERGVPVDILADDPPRGVLTMAINCGHQEIADYLRSKGALEDHEIRARDQRRTAPK